MIDTLSRPLDREREKDLRIETTPAIPARYGKTIATVSFREQELATKKKKKKKEREKRFARRFIQQKVQSYTVIISCITENRECF